MFDRKNLVQVLHKNSADDTIEWYILWQSLEHEKAVSNAKKRSKQYPQFLFRAFSTFGNGQEYLYKSYGALEHKATYFVGGEEVTFPAYPHVAMNASRLGIADPALKSWSADMDKWIRAHQQLSLYLYFSGYKSPEFNGRGELIAGRWEEFNKSAYQANLVIYDSITTNKKAGRNWAYHLPDFNSGKLYRCEGYDAPRATGNLLWVEHVRHCEKLSMEQVSSIEEANNAEYIRKQGVILPDNYQRVSYTYSRADSTVMNALKNRQDLLEIGKLFGDIANDIEALLSDAQLSASQRKLLLQAVRVNRLLGAKLQSDKKS